MIPGFIPEKRNSKAFSNANIQMVYNKICRMLPFGRNNFIYPAIEPDMALYGWYNDAEHAIFPNENLNNDEKVLELIKEMKTCNMISHDEVVEIKLKYHAVNQWAHQANIIFQFANPVKYMN